MRENSPPESRETCAVRDREDKLAGLRELFELAEDVIYLDGNSLGALPRATGPRLAEVVTQQWGEGLIRSWNSADWIGFPQRVGDKIGSLIGAHPGEVVATDSTSVNLFKVLAAALGIQARTKPERTLIVSERLNFPTDLYVAQGLMQLLNGDGASGYELLLVDGEEEFSRALVRGPAVVMLTHVNYRSGHIHDMARVSARVRACGAMMLWDLAHSAGAVPVDINTAGADFAVGCGYKYLNGGPGAPAFVWVPRRHQDSFAQPLSGWMGHAQPFLFEGRYRPAPGISRYLCGTPPILSMAALECGVDTVLAATPLGGVAALYAKTQALTQLFIELVEAQVPTGMLELASPRDAQLRGCQVSFAASADLEHGYPVMQALIASGVIGDFRAPNLLRFGFAPLYTRFVDAYDAALALVRVINDGSWNRAQYRNQAAVT